MISFSMASDGECAGIWAAVKVHMQCGPFVCVITLIDTEKAQMHAIVIIGHRLIFST